MNAEQRRTTPARHEILELLSDAEASHVTEEEGGQLTRGEEYIDLVHLAQGVHRALTSDALNIEGFIRRGAVSAETWSKICSTLRRAPAMIRAQRMALRAQR